MDDGGEETADEGGARMRLAMAAEGGAHLLRRLLRLQKRRQRHQQIFQHRVGQRPLLLLLLQTIPKRILTQFQVFAASRRC